MALRNMRIWRYIDEVSRAGSVRQAAERLHVTPSALLRRIQDVEHDLGAPIFERDTTGVTLTAAGEIFVGWIRSQEADLRRVYSQIEDLSGLKRGEVSIACSQAVQSFVVEHIKRFRQAHPLVRFRVTIADHNSALTALSDYVADLVLVFRPPHAIELQPIMTLGQRMVAIMAHDHPLAGRATLRLRDLADYEIALPGASFGGREIIEQILAKTSMRLNVMAEANSFSVLADLVRGSELVTFQIEIGALKHSSDPELAIRPVDDVDLAHGPLVLGQLKGRALPLPAAKFAEQLSASLNELRSMPMAI
ncbi:LysR family transcriptional regulator [Phenylobacterium sp. LjRoot225]|uniref:LysR family transcriptional regulator n=1 Tax=Phenylobacterium sp. LjRoot225 TaxID=3342285 RepID=UPI003ECD00FC